MTLVFLPMVARIVYTQTRLRANAFTHKLFYARTLLHTTLLHTNTFTHRRFYTDPFTHKHFYTQTLLHRPFCTQTLLHKHFYTQTLLHTDPWGHNPLHTQTRLHTDPFGHKPPSHTNTFAHKRFYTETLLHTHALTHKRFDTQTFFSQKRFYTQTLLHTNTFTHKGKALPPDQPKPEKPSVFDTRKGCRRGCQIAKKYQILTLEHHFVQKGCRRGYKIAKKQQLLTLEPHFVRNGCRRTNQTRKKPSVFDIRTSFRAKGLVSAFSDRFWKLRFRKSARRRGAKHISKSKCTRHTILGPLLEVAMSKKCTPLWREGHFEVNMVKTSGVRTAFGRSDVEKAHAVAARGTFRRQNGKNTMGSDHFWTFRRRKSARRCRAKMREAHSKSTC